MKRIVLLNDELKTQMQLYLALCDTYRVEVAENIEAVMYMLRKMHPDILLMDYNLQHFTENGKTSLDFVRKVKKKYSHLKVMMLLNDHDRMDEEEIQENGADGVIYQPVKNHHLLKFIKALSLQEKVITS